MSNISFMHIEDKSPVYTEAVYAPEALLTEWLAVVFACMTSSLLFYHMTRLKTLVMDPRLAAVFACSLISVGILYNLSAIVPYTARMDHQLSLTDDVDIIYQLNILKYTFLVLAGITTLIQSGICIIIFNNTLLYF
jgi:hypothetical protein